MSLTEIYIKKNSLFLASIGLLPVTSVTRMHSLIHLGSNPGVGKANRWVCVDSFTVFLRKIIKYINKYEKLTRLSESCYSAIQ